MTEHITEIVSPRRANFLYLNRVREKENEKRKKWIYSVLFTFLKKILYEDT